MQICETLVHDAFPAAGAGAGNVVGQIVDEQAIAGRAIGEPAAMFKEFGPRLAHPDLVGQNQVVEMPQGAGKLTAIAARMQFVGVAAEKQPVARLQQFNQAANFRIGPKDVAPGFDQEPVVAA